MAFGAPAPRLLVVGGVVAAGLCGLALLAGADDLGPITRASLATGAVSFLAGTAPRGRRVAWPLGAGAVAVAAWLYAAATREVTTALLVALPGALLAAAAWLDRPPAREHRDAKA